MSEAERKAKRVRPLSDEEVARLEALGVRWDPLAEQWEKNYAALRAFCDREGHANVPNSHKTADGLKLGNWLSNQRQRYQLRGMSEAEGRAKTNARPLSDEEVARLEELGVAWDAAAEQWESNYAALRAFRDREGHANVPRNYKTADGLKLGGWLSDQRTRYRVRGMSEAERRAKTKATPLSDEEVARLEALGVVWDVLVEQWEKNYAALRAFRDREGHANVPRSHKTADGLTLGNWLSDQRKRYQVRGMSEAERKAKRVSALSDEEVARFEALGVRWRK